MTLKSAALSIAARAGMAEDAKRVCLGRAIGARGLKGEVRIKTFTEDPLAISSYGPLQDEAGTRQFELLNVKAARDGVVARLKGAPGARIATWTTMSWEP